MTTLTLERHFPAPVDKVFTFVTRTEHLVTWFGAAPKVVVDHGLDFTRLGPWFATFRTRDGNEITVSGQVTHIDAPHSVGFTWSWHDDDGNRRPDESHVTFTLAATESGGTDFTLTHVNLATEEAAANHRVGWTISLDKLQSMATA